MRAHMQNACADYGVIISPYKYEWVDTLRMRGSNVR